MSEFIFHEKTTPAVRAAILDAYHQQCMVRVWYGNFETGRAWLEEYDVIGRVGRSTGQQKVPLLVAKGEIGGLHIMDHCIVRIDRIERSGNVTMYRHPFFNLPDFSVSSSDLEGYVENVWAHGELVARFRSPGEADHWVKFHQGLVNSPRMPRRRKAA